MPDEKRENAPIIVWFRKDLRLADNPALTYAVSLGRPIIPVFIWAPEEFGQWAPAAASRWWLYESLSAFIAQFEALSGRLVLKTGGSSQKILDELIRESGATLVLWNRRYEASLRAVDAGIKKSLRSDGIDVESFNGSLLNEPHTVATGAGKPYKVYTPYWNKVKEREEIKPFKLDVSAMKFPAHFPETDTLDSLDLLPKVQWYRGFYSSWQPGEEGAKKRLAAFLDGIVEEYDSARDLPAEDGTSSLSPHLHWGEIGPRQVMFALREKYDLRAKGPLTYAKEIYWREFAYNVLYHFPETPDHPLRSEYSDFPWKEDKNALRAWQTGQTGYPIVDAGMRQLWQTGWMHNRVRMIVSSLLVKHLLQDWKEGAKWFWDTLLDADLASNTLGWQWSGGCGADAAPYFRVFNPITQGKKFDEDGEYVRKYVPELKHLDSMFIHEPWEAPQFALKKAGIELGVDYPRPIIEHKKGRERALTAFAEFRK